MYQSAKPADVVHAAFFFTCQPASVAVAEDVSGYQKCEPVSGSE
jgi:hypothetical protein